MFRYTTRLSVHDTIGGIGDPDIWIFGNPQNFRGGKTLKYDW